MGNHDTHRGELRPDGIVLAFDRAGLCGYPPDAGQVCPVTGSARWAVSPLDFCVHL